MKTAPMSIATVKVIARTPNTATVQVRAKIAGRWQEIVTELGEGNHVPSATVLGSNRQLPEDVVIALHEWLHKIPLVETEMRRIGG